MLPSPCNNRGFTLVEAVIAIFITTTAVMAIFALMGPAWKTTSRSDLTGRAGNILYDQLQQQEARIMNYCNDITAIDDMHAFPVAVYASGRDSGGTSGDAAFRVKTIIAAITTDVWQVTVQVSWPGHTAISDSLIVTRQNDYGYPVDGSGTCI